jgi:hypothetical protein
MVIFEVEPETGRAQDYLDIAARLRPELEKIDVLIQSVAQHQAHASAYRVGRIADNRAQASGAGPGACTL